MLFRDTNPDCFTCGAQLPTEAEENGRGPLRIYECPDCHMRILSGIVQRNGVTERVPIRAPPWLPDEVTQLASDGWTTWEIWWTNTGTYVSLINGRVIHGNEEFLTHVKKIREVSNDGS